MPDYDATCGQCWVFTEKLGLLSAVGHNLRLRVERFEVRWPEVAEGEGMEVVAAFDPTSLVVDAVMQGEMAQPHGLSTREKRTIAQTIRAEVLDTERFPEIRFHSRPVVPNLAGFELPGELTLHGTMRPVGVQVRSGEGRWVAEAKLHQPDFGIAPYSAMLGTLKVAPQVRVQLHLPMTG